MYKGFKKKHYLFVVVVFFLFAFNVYASLEITEIMYDPEGTDTNREWVKLCNNGEETINIISGKNNSAWRIGDGESGEALHYISEDLNIMGGGYAVIAKDKDTFLSEYSSFSGSVASSSISLVNTSGVVKIYDGSSPRNIIASKSYEANENLITEEDNDSEENTEESNNSSNNYFFSSKKSEPKITKTIAEIITNKIATAGLALPIESKITNNKGITLNTGRFIWNFGDGEFRISEKLEKLEHIYWYPGEYVLTLSYYKKGKTELEATSRVVVKVLPSGVAISSVGNSLDSYIELENKSNYEIDLSNWTIQSPVKNFMIPEGMVLLPNKKIKLSPKITQFNINDIGFLSIINSNGETMAIYPNKIKSINKNTPSSYNGKSTPTPDVDTNLNTDESEVINLNNLPASAIKSNIDFQVVYYLLGLLLVVGLGIASVLLLRKKDDLNEDYIEGKITANDIKIIE